MFRSPILARAVLIVAIAVLSVLRPSTASAADLPRDVESLKNVDRIDVIVEDIEEDAERDGLHRSDIQTAVEVQLRKAGIKLDDDGVTPYLYVRVRTLLHKDGRLYSYHIEVSFQQGCRPMNNPELRLFARTWEADGAVGSVGKDLVGNLQKSVELHVNEFINAYVQAHQD